MIKVKKTKQKNLCITIYTFIQQIIDHIPDIIPSKVIGTRPYLSHYTEEVILLEQMSEWNY